MSMRGLTAPRVLAMLGRSRAAALPRFAVEQMLGGRLRVVRVVGGVARGARLELDLGCEKAYWLGSYEPATQAFLRSHVSPGDVVYDVGAHIGFFSVCAARLGARVYAFEAAGSNASRISRQAELNGLPIEVIEAAVWDSDLGVDLVEGDSSSEWHAVGGESVSSLTLDEFVVGHEPPALVKIDVEGAEGRVLRGAENLLRRYRPTILCEVHGPLTRNEVLGCLEAYEVEQVGGPTRIGAHATTRASAA